MNNSIIAVSVQCDARDPACAVVRVSVTPAAALEGMEIRGRLMGPTCIYAHTIEVAYAFQSEGTLAAVARIPEANLWHPVSPHLYAGPVELWHQGRLLDRRTIRLGLRTLALGPSGLRLNGRVLPLQVQRVTGLSEDEARTLHNQGVNCLITAPEPAWFDLADRIGFLIACDTDAKTIAAFMHHPSCLGWLDPSVPASDSPVELPGLRVMDA